MSEPGSERLGLPDVNVLVALTNPSHQHHRAAHAWLANAEAFATTPITEAGLVRLLLNPAVTGQTVSGSQAVGLLRALRADPRASFLEDDTTLAAAHIDLIGLASHKQVTDLHLVNLAAAKACVLVTFDRKLAHALPGAHTAHVHLL